MRFITLNSNLRSQANLEAELGIDLADLPSAEFRSIYIGMQTRWLEEVLTSSDANWNVVQFHHPTMSVSQGRNNADWRAAFLPMFIEHNVDLVLSGHDHTYARGYLDADATDTPGVSDGPVFIVTNSGPKYYELATDATNLWLLNGATQVVKHAQVSFIQGMRVTPDTLEYEAIVAQKGSRPTSDLEIGETADTFTITRHDNGSKSVREGIDRRVATGLGGIDVEPAEGDIRIDATVPEAVSTAGALTISIGDSSVNMGAAHNAGDRWSFSAALPRIAVTDTRREAAGWSLTGGVGDLTSGASTLSSAHLGWVPRVLGGRTAEAGPAVKSRLNGGEGLSSAHLLASADDHSRFGTTELIADVALDVPVDTQGGDYTGAVNVTLFPVD